MLRPLRMLRPLKSLFLLFAVSLLAGSIALGRVIPLTPFACTPTGSNYVNTLDVPPGGLLVNAGLVTCGQSAGCDTNEGNVGCCAGPGATSGGVCVLDAGGCPTGTGLQTCNETADCDIAVNGQLQPCCGTVAQSGDAGVLSSECASATTCPAGNVQLCRTNGECPGDKCVIQLCPDGLIYEMCGLSTSASFPCKLVPVDGG